MILQDYLNTNFTLLTDSQKLIDHFFEEFGVNVKNEEDLYIFKYDMIAAKWTNSLTHECRGTIMRYTSNCWEICSRPWNKFFNYHEGYSGLYKSDDFNKFINDKYNFIMEKVDGTAIQMWYDEVKKQWRISTLGTITTTKVNDDTCTYEELFWEIMGGKDKLNNIPLLAQNYTYLFELCSKKNRILTRYPTDRIYLISARNNFSGEYDDTLLDITWGINGIMKPVIYTFEELGLTSMESVLKFVEDESKKSHIYGDFSEGFVCYRLGGTPMAKIKNATYLSLHHLM